MIKTSIAPVTNSASEPSVSIYGSEHIWQWLNRSQISLSFTTYQTNRLFLIGCNPSGRLAIHERLYDKPMGLYADDDKLIMTTRYQIWELENRLAPQETHHQHDKLYVPSKSYTTGDVNAHDVVVDSDQNILFINTDFSCLATIEPGYSFAPVWTPPFITKLAAEDRCHLNGLAMVEGQPTYVTACSSTDDAAGWRNHRTDGGVVVHIPSNEIITTGLSMPHSPRWYQGKLWLLNAGSGELGYLDGEQFIPLTFCPGFVRGLAFHEHFAVVGLSKLRSKTFGGLALEDRLAAEGKTSQCGLMVIDLNTGEVVHWLHIDGVVEELFDVVVLPGVSHPQVVGFQGEEIERLVNFPQSGGMMTTKPTVKRPTVGFAPTAGLPREERRDRGTIPAPTVKYQRVYHLTPANLAPYDEMTFPSLQQRWQTQPQQGEIVAVSASIEGEMVGFTLAEILPDRTVELLSLFVAPEYRQQGIGKHLMTQLQQDLSAEVGSEINLLNRPHPPLPSPQTPAQILLAQGKQARLQGDYSLAQACFEEAIQLQPDFMPAYNRLGNLFQTQGKIAQAIEIYQQALTLAPDLPALHCNLASLWQTQGDRDLAITGYQKSIDLDPDFWLAHYNLGKLFATESDFTAAISAYQSALKIKPTAAEIELELGHIYRAQGLISVE
jgi:protein O-GlcNAc transferase